METWSVGAEPRRRVDRVTKHRVLNPAARPHEPDHGRAAVDTDAPTDRRQSLLEQLLLQLGTLADHLVRATKREERMVFLMSRRIPERHDLVPDVFVEGAVPREDDSTQVIEVHLDDLGYILGLHRLRHRGEAANVGKEHRDVATLPAADDVFDAASGSGKLGDDLRLQHVTEKRGDLALLAVLVKEPISGDAGVRQRQDEPRMK